MKIELESGDGIEIGRDVKNLNHICCDCGLKHKIKVEWLEDSVILKFKRGGKIGQVEPAACDITPIIEYLMDSFDKAQKHIDGGNFYDLEMACDDLIVSNAEFRQL